MTENPVPAFENFVFLFRNLRLGRENLENSAAELVFSIHESFLTRVRLVLRLSESGELGDVLLSASHSFNFATAR